MCTTDYGTSPTMLKNLDFFLDFPGGPVVKSPPANPGDMGSIPGPGRSQYCGAPKPMHHN